jgi:hypothetical protein
MCRFAQQDNFCLSESVEQRPESFITKRWQRLRSFFYDPNGPAVPLFVTTGVVVTMAWVTFLYRVGTGLLGY